MNEHDLRQAIDYLLTGAGVVFVGLMQVLWARITKLEEKVDANMTGVTESFRQVNEVNRQEHAQLREQMERQHNQIIGILMNRGNNNGN